jgi:hypothetical protein
MRWAQNVVLVTIALAVLGCVVILYGIIPGQSEDTTPVSLAFDVAATVLHIGAALLFLLTLRVYKAKLKPAYVLSSLAIVIVALGTLQIPLFTALEYMDSPWITQGGIGLPFLLSGFFAYTGSRRLARLVELKSPLASFRLVLPAVIGLCILVVVLPHAESADPNAATAISSAINVWAGGLFFVAALLTWKVMHAAGLHYRNSMLSIMVDQNCTTQ